MQGIYVGNNVYRTILFTKLSSYHRISSCLPPWNYISLVILVQGTQPPITIESWTSSSCQEPRVTKQQPHSCAPIMTIITLHLSDPRADDPLETCVDRDRRGGKGRVFTWITPARPSIEIACKEWPILSEVVEKNGAGDSRSAGIYEGALHPSARFGLWTTRNQRFEQGLDYRNINFHVKKYF